MRLQSNLARIRPEDVESLNEASELLAAVHSTIKTSKATWLPACEALLIKANDIVIAVRDRGLTRIQAVLAKMEDQADAAARAKQAAQDAAGENQPELSGWPTSEHDAIRLMVEGARLEKALP